ncbi:hypothetical protein [Phaffia rhodozyma]|uniref:FIST domain-containing protein n=1 Tax=Phaffia rhodozyma TaxID=264483 RepID=A0A0F7SS27_PHARH|nr:hypothetical protein [Phaffia rhodozyma]
MSIRQRIHSPTTAGLSRRKYSFAHTVISSDLSAFLRTYTPPTPPRSIISPSAAPSATIYTLPQESTSLHTLIPLIHEKFPNSIGCLASSFEDRPRRTDTISIAHFWDTDRTTYRLFRSAEKGKDPASVGRWRPIGETSSNIQEGGDKGEGNVLERAVKGGDWSDVWEEWKKSNVGGQVDGQVVDLEGLESVDPAQIGMTFLFSTPTSLSPTFDLLPSISCKAGLVLPQTPFTTGRPYTLYFMNQTYDQGAVGLAIISEGDIKEKQGEGVRMDIGWEGMEPVEAQVYEVVSSQGNLLLSISRCASDPEDTIANPTKHLIMLLQESSSAGFDHKSYLGSKEKEFFLGLIRPRGREGVSTTEDQGSMGHVNRVVRILSGDPARGGMAIEREDSLQIGERFMFVHRPNLNDQIKYQNQDPNQNMEGSPLTSHTFAFRTSSSSTTPPTGTADSSNSELEQLSIEGFDCSSEAGFIVCLAPGEDEDKGNRPAGRGFADKGIEGGRLIVKLGE